DRTPVSLSPALDARVMAAVRRRAASPVRRAWRRLVEPREFELRLRIRPWIAWGGALAVAAATALVVLGRPSVIPAGGPTPTRVAARDSIYVRFVLYAPGAKRVAVAGTVNQWAPNGAPLVQKAVEGGAKGVPSDRVIAAVRALAARLDEAAGALRAAGLSNPDADLVDGTAYALSQGLSAAQVRDLARAIHAPYDAATTLRVAATLSGLGVPPKQTVQLVEGVLQSGGTPDDVLDLPSEVEAGIANGASAAQA